MSFSGGTLETGTLVSKFTIDASGAKTTIDSINQSATQIKNAFGNVQIKIDGAQAKSALDSIAAATVALKTAQAQSTTALGDARVATAAQTAALTEQRTATEAVRTATATTRDEIAKLSLAQKQAAQDAKDHATAHGPLQSALGGTSQLVQTLTMNMGGLGQGIQQATMAAGGFSGPLLAIGIPLAAVALGLGAAAKAAVDFQSTVVQVANNTNMTNADIAAMGTGIKQLALIIPESTTAMAEGWRHAADEGFNAADSLKIVAAASEAAANTGASASDAIFLVSQALHAYHEPATDAMLVTNQLVEAAKQGNTTFAQMAASIGPLIAQAASLHIPFQDIVAAMSAMTQNGYPADQAVTGLTNLLKEVEAPSQKARDAIAALGARGAQLEQDFTPAGLAGRGLYGVMKDLGDATGGDNAKILEILPQLRGFRTGVVLAGTGLDDYTTAMDRQADVMSGKLKPTQDDFARTMDTVGAKMTVLKNTVEVLAIDLGTVLLPILTRAVQGMIDFAQSVGLVTGASGFVDLKKQIQDVNDSYAQTKSVQDAIAAANATGGDSAATASAKTIEATQAAADSLTNTKQAAASLDEALGFPNGVAGIGAATASLGELEQSARGEATSALNSVNTALALPEGSLGTKDATKYLGDLKDAGNDAAQVVRELNVELASNRQQLDENAAAIQSVKEIYDPQIKSAEESIARINLPTAAETARKADEMNLDVKKANLELTKPDTSVYDNKILADQTTLDTMPALDTSSWDTNISGYQAQIQSLQDSISGLNTDEFDRKINAIKDTLSQPAPDTQGISNQLKTLEAQLAGGTISQSQFDASYGALSRQKQGINTAYTDQTSGLSAQLKLLEQQRADQVLANQETARSDRASMDSLKDKLALEEAGRKKAVADDAKARKDLQDDIKTEGNLRTQALKPYTDAMKQITDAQAHNAALDAAAAAQRKLDLAPYEASLDTLKQKETDALAPLLLKKQTLDDNATKLNEEKTKWDGIKGAIGDATTALGDYIQQAQTLNPAGGAGNGNGAGGNAGAPPMPPPYDLSNVSKYDEFGQPYIAAPPDLPILAQLKSLKQWLIDNGPGIFDGIKNEAKLDLSGLFQGIDFVKSLAQLLSDLYNGNWSKIGGDLSALGKATLAGTGGTGGPSPVSGTGITTDTQGAFGTGTSSGPASKPPSIFGMTMDTPLDKKIGDVNEQITQWLKDHGMGALTNWSWLPGGGDNRVGASGLDGQMGEVDKFTQHIQDQLGDSGGAQQAIQSFKDQIVKEMGDGSDAATAVADAEKSFTDKFGDGGTVPAALTQTGDAATTSLGNGGTVPTILQILRDNHVPLTVSGLLKAFGQGGDAPTAITQTGDAATTTLGPNGTFSQATRSAVGTSQSAFGQGGFIDQHLGNTDRTITGTLGTGGTGQTAMTSFDSHTGSIFGGDGTIIGYFQQVMNWLKGDWQAISADIARPFTDAQAPIQNFWSFLGGGINWLAEHFKLPSVTPYGGGTSSGATGGGGPAGNGTLPGAANGLGGGMPGHWSMIGEKGPEAMYVPAGATIIPNHLLPGHADGLNLPGVFDALLSSKGGNLKGTAGAFADALAANLGTPAIPGLDGGGAALSGAVKDGVYNWLKDSAVNIGPLSGLSGGGSALAIVNAVKSVTSDPDIWLAMLMAVASEQRTLSGPFVDQIGGGPGRGPFQIEAGPGGSNFGMISEDDARDPVKAARYMVGRFIAAKRGPWGADNETAGAMTAAAAEVGRAFLDGNPLGYDQSVVDAAYAMATRALAAPVAAGPFQSGGFPAVLGSAQGDIGQMFHDNHAWNLWCEQFAEYAGEQSGYPHLGWASALAHADGVTLNSGIGPPGATMLWGSGYYVDGHAAISVGDGSVIGTSPQGVQRYDMANAPDYRGWAPPGLAEGGSFSVPTTVTVGDGGQREFVLPESDLRAIVRSESRGGAPSITFQPGAITVDKGGAVAVDPSRISFQAAWAASGH